MRRTRIFAVMLALLLALPYGIVGLGDSAIVADASGSQYYYSQLKDDAKKFYDAMYEMYVQGIFKTGTQGYDLVKEGHMTSGQLAAYEGRQEELLRLFGAARDAFYADYPDIFYVDFSSLSVTVSSGSVPGADGTEDGSAVYQVSLGTGRGDTYFVEGFSDAQQVEDAVRAQNARIEEIVQGAKGHSTSVREQVSYVYKAVIERTEYRLDTNCDEGNAGHVRTSYGALVRGQSLCEGYARAVKTVLDKMGISSVLVQGSYRASDGSDNLHMWNYVQIDGKWYGLDATAGDGMKGTVDSDKYLLADQAVMGENHRPDGVMSASGFRFTYPQLTDAGNGSDDSDTKTDEGDPDSGKDPNEGETDDSGYRTLFDKEGFQVQYRDGTAAEGEVGVFKVSYKGKGYQEAVDSEGVYILSRFCQYWPGTGEYEAGNWGYSDPKPFAMPQLADALVLANGNSRYIEFAITKKAPAGPLYGDSLTAEELKKNWNFQGTEEDFIVSTGKLDNPKGTYIPSPFAKKVTPGNTGFITCGKKYHVTAVFNEQLEQIDGESAGYQVAVKDGWSAEQHSTIENFKWDNDRTVEFDFTPSDQLADNYAIYTFQITGLQGKKSLKAPDSFSYSAKKKISICAFRPQGIYLNLGAKPQLLEPVDIFCGDWVNEHGEKLRDVKNIVLTASKPELVVETPDDSQSEEMLGMIGGKLPEGCTIERSATYNLRLMICNQNIIQTGQSVRLNIGFPQGYGPENAGVSYKAYHFLRDKDKKITGVEELDCIVTDKGLIVTCHSFSPFAVVALKGDERADTIQKLLVMNSAGGKVKIQEDVDARICEMLEKGQTRTIEIKADEGYLISGLYLNGQSEKVADKKSMKYTVRYEDLDGEGNILDVEFAEDRSAGQETAPAVQEKGNSAPSQNAPAGGHSGSSESASDNVSVSNGTASASNNSRQTDSKADTVPTAVLPQGNTDVVVGDQVSAAPTVSQTTAPVTPSVAQAAAPVIPPVASSSASATITGDVVTDVGVKSSGSENDVAEVITPDTEAGQERIVLPAGENSMELVVLPADAHADEEKTGKASVLLIVLGCVAAVGMVALAVAGVIQMRRDADN